MTRHFNPRDLQFYMTMPTPCPYLPGRQERKLFTQIDPISGHDLTEYLTHSGFRRSQNVLYRPACETCNACRSLRVLVNDFTPTKSMKRVLSRNQDLRRIVQEPYATREQFALMQKYLLSRHADGGMAEMDFARYEMMVEDGASITDVVEYRLPDDTLIAAVLIDHLSDGMSMVYSFFDPEQSHRSLGNYMILDHIQRCKDDVMPTLYLGYWVENSQKMDYKARYKPHQILGLMGWYNPEDDNE